MRTVGRGGFAPPILSPPDVPYGSRWSFDRRTRTLTGSGVGFYRDQFDLLRADQVKASLTSLVTITLHILLITFSRVVSMGPFPRRGIRCITSALRDIVRESNCIFDMLRHSRSASP